MALSSKDYVLLMIGSAGGEGVGPVQLQKGVFILENVLRHEGMKHTHVFERGNYGPFCAEVFRDVELLEDAGLVAYSFSGGRHSHRQCRATPRGMEEFEKIVSADTHDLAAWFGQFWRWISALSPIQLIGYVSSKWPEYAVKSCLLPEQARELVR